MEHIDPIYTNMAAVFILNLIGITTAYVFGRWQGNVLATREFQRWKIRLQQRRVDHVNQILEGIENAHRPH